MEINQIVALCIISAALTALLFSWFYERELGRANATTDRYADRAVELTFENCVLKAQLEAAQRTHWNFNLDAIGNGVPNAELVPLFDEDLMQGNQD
jgi:hypothetical protein